MTEHRCAYTKEFQTSEKRCTKRADWVILVEDEQTKAQDTIWICNLHKEISLELVQSDEDIKILAIQELKEKVEFT
jgi:hypothetical protein